MANYDCRTRTNYFQVNDENKFKELAKGLFGDNDEVLFFEKKQDGHTFHSFGSYGSINYKAPEQTYEDASIEEFFRRIQPLLPDNEAFIMVEVGAEKLRYTCAYTSIVTNKKITYVDLEEETIKKAQDILNNPEFNTVLSY